MEVSRKSLLSRALSTQSTERQQNRKARHNVKYLLEISQMWDPGPSFSWPCMGSFHDCVGVGSGWSCFGGTFMMWAWGDADPSLGFYQWHCALTLSRCWRRVAEWGRPWWSMELMSSLNIYSTSRSELSHENKLDRSSKCGPHVLSHTQATKRTIRTSKWRWVWKNKMRTVQDVYAVEWNPWNIDAALKTRELSSHSNVRTLGWEWKSRHHTLTKTRPMHSLWY